MVHSCIKKAVFNWVIIIITLFLNLNFVSAQSNDISNIRYRTFLPDTFSVFHFEAGFLPHTLQVVGTDSLRTDLTNLFYILGNTLLLRVNKDSLGKAPFTVMYRIIQGKYFEPFRLFDTSIIAARWDPSLNIESIKGIESGLILAKSKMDYRGSFTRGIAVGNNQDLTLNSGFNLQLAGEIGNDLRIQGAMTDNNIPIQPEGTTQQLQEFDKVYIVVSNKNSELTAGDFELSKPKSFFINYYKKLQGVQIANSYKMNRTTTISSKGGIAITKGKYNRINLKVTEGNQGPYRLPGGEGEVFVVVLSGTEKVYLNGILLSRGYDRDYIIDYNSGELTFMPATVITKDARIIVEYEYSNQQYLRSSLYGGVNIIKPKWEFNVNAYSEQDGKNSNRSRELSKEDKLLLAQLGDSTSNTLVNSIKVIDAAADLSVISYSLVDTLANGVTYRIMSFPWRIGTDRLVAEFVDVGAGNYIRQDKGVNGRVYQWVAPDPVTGRPTGKFEPLTRLIAPNQQQMFSASAAWTPDSTLRIGTEVALSNRDLNRFSRLDDANNQGIGLAVNAEKNKIRLNVKGTWLLSAALQYEYAAKNFTAINPYRPVEFVRDWNLPALVLNDQHILKAQINQIINKKLNVNYLFSMMNQGDQFSGYKNELNAALKLNKTQISGYVNYLKSSATLERTAFLRPGFSVVQSFPRVAGAKIGLTYNGEYNRRRNIATDTLLNISYSFDVYKVFIQNNFGEKFKTEISYQLRQDNLPANNQLISANHSREIGLKANWQSNENNSISLNGTIRKFNVEDNRFSEKFKSRDTYIGQAEYLFNWFKRRLSGSTFIEASSGQEQKFEWNYIKVVPGQGVYSWVDYNQDSIQQINEFIIAPFPDQAEYTRVTILSNQFISTLNSAFSQSLRWEPKTSAESKGAFVKFINKFSLQSFYRLDRKIYDKPVRGFWNPLYAGVVDSALVTLAQSQRHVLFFNRGSTLWEMQLQYTDNASKSLLASGFERRGLRDLTLQNRVNVGASWNIYLYLTGKTKSSQSELFVLNDYSIQGREIRPEVSVIIRDKMRLTSGYKWFSQRNTTAIEASSISNNLFFKIDYNRSNLSAFNAQLTYVNNQFDGPVNSAIEFAMLEGLKDGSNFVWGIGYDQNLKNNIQLNFGYDGRKSGSGKTIHTGKASVKAFF